MIEQDFGAFVGGGASGKNVIDEDNRFVMDACFPLWLECESVFEVFESLRPTEAGLGFGVADTF